MRKFLFFFCLCLVAQVAVATNVSAANLAIKKPLLHRPNYATYKPHVYRHGLSRLLHFGKH